MSIFLWVQLGESIRDGRICFVTKLRNQNYCDNSPGLVVGMGRDSRSEGRGFESWYCILDGHFFTYLF